MSHTEENQLPEVDSILNCFSHLDDPRSHINRVHQFGDLIVICIMAVIAGADGPQAIGLWAKANQRWLKERLDLPGGIPSHDTLGRSASFPGHRTSEQIDRRPLTRMDAVSRLRNRSQTVSENSMAKLSNNVRTSLGHRSILIQVA